MEVAQWEERQTRVFTGWVNSVLRSHFGEQAPQIKSLFTDFASGVMLLHLFEALFSKRGVQFPKINEAATMRPQHIDNVTTVLSILPSVGVMTVFLTPTQLVDGDKKMTLGLIWRLILATQVMALKTTSVEGVLGGDERQVDGGAKASLLEWVRNRVAPFGLSVNNFTSDWQSGMLFLALICSQAQLLDFAVLDESRGADNLNLAFEIALNEFQIAKLLTVQDVMQHPDERCIMTYVSEFALKFDILGRPTPDDGRTQLLDAREQELAMREAELQKQMFEQSEELKKNTQKQLSELEAKGHELTELEKRQKAELERAIQMQKAADARMAEAALMGAEAAKKHEELEKARIAGEQERMRLGLLESNLKEQADALAAQAEKLRLDQEGIRAQQGKETAEKEFAEAANAMDAFLVEENRKLEAPDCNLQPMLEFGIAHGEGLLQRVRGCGQRAGEMGLTSNRFTHHTTSQLEERFKQFVQELQSRQNIAQAPTSQYPAPPPAGGQMYPPPQEQSAYPPVPSMGMPPNAAMGAPSQYPNPTPSMGMPPGGSMHPPQQPYPGPNSGARPPPQHQQPYPGPNPGNRPPQIPQQYAQQPQHAQQPYPPQGSVQHVYHQQQPPPMRVGMQYPVAGVAPMYPVANPYPVMPVNYGYVPTYGVGGGKVKFKKGKMKYKKSKHSKHGYHY